MEKPLVLRFPKAWLKEHPAARRGSMRTVCPHNVYYGSVHGSWDIQVAPPNARTTTAPASYGGHALKQSAVTCYPVPTTVQRNWFLPMGDATWDNADEVRRGGGP